MLGGVVAKRYASALFSVAQEKNLVDSVESDLASIISVLDEHPKFKRILMHPAISTSVKKQQVEELFGKAVSEIVLNFLRTLLDRRRQNELPAIYDAFVEMSNEAKGRVRAHIETAVPLNETELKDLGEKLGAACGKKLDLTASVDPELIAGVRLKVGSRLLDASVKGQLEKFSQQLKRNQVR